MKDITIVMNELNKQQRRLEIGENIHTLRRRLGLTQEEIVDQLGCSRFKLYRVEKGITDISYVDLEHLADIFGIHIMDLVNLHGTSIDKGI